MKSLEKSNSNSSDNVMPSGPTAQILESGQGIRMWAKEKDRSIAATYDGCLKELASSASLREHVLSQIDHSAARVFYKTGDMEFDCYVGTVLSMQTLARGISHKEALEELSMELLDRFLDLHERQMVTRAWLGQLMSKQYRASNDGIYRFGELARIAMLAASLLGYHDNDPIFLWAIENREGIEESTSQQWSRLMGEVLDGDGYPGFDFWVVHHPKRDIVRRVDIDTTSLFCRRLLRESTQDMDHWGDIQCMNNPFFNEFVQSIGFTPRKLEDFTVETFDRQIRWFQEKPGNGGCSNRFLCRFYRHVLTLLLGERTQVEEPVQRNAEIELATMEIEQLKRQLESPR